MEQDCAERYETTTIPAGKDTMPMTLDLRTGATDNRTVVITLIGGEGVNVGCPSQSLIVIRR